MRKIIITLATGLLMTTASAQCSGIDYYVHPDSSTVILKLDQCDYNLATMLPQVKAPEWSVEEEDEDGPRKVYLILYVSKATLEFLRTNY